MVESGLELIKKTLRNPYMEHGVPSENFLRETGTTFLEVQFFPEIFHWNEPKTHVPFTTQPEFPESLGKWKTPSTTDFPSVLSLYDL